VAAATGRLLSSAVGASGTWVARIDGKPGAVQYALEVTPGVYEHVGGRRRAGWIVLRGLDEMQARSLLDAAETVAVSVALFRTSVDASMALSESLSGATATLNSVRPDLAVIKAAGYRHIVIGRLRTVTPFLRLHATLTAVEEVRVVAAILLVSVALYRGLWVSLNPALGSSASARRCGRAAVPPLLSKTTPRKHPRSRLRTPQ
jgi:hypothetical protein